MASALYPNRPHGYISLGNTFGISTALSMVQIVNQIIVSTKMIAMFRVNDYYALSRMNVSVLLWPLSNFYVSLPFHHYKLWIHKFRSQKTFHRLKPILGLLILKVDLKLIIDLISKGVNNCLIWLITHCGFVFHCLIISEFDPFFQASCSLAFLLLWTFYLY